MEKMNKNVENMLNQINNTMSVLDGSGFLYYYNSPSYNVAGNNVQISWNNHQGGREVSSKYFLRIEQYLKILESKAYLAILSDYSIVRCSFVYDKEKLVSENLLWWPAPVVMDRDMVDEFGLQETIEICISEKKNLRMRSPIRIDFDSSNDTEDHPRAHMHTQHDECRINTYEPICFNRFMNYIIKCYYPDWKIPFRREDFLSITYDKGKSIRYNNTTNIRIGY